MCLNLQNQGRGSECVNFSLLPSHIVTSKTAQVYYLTVLEVRCPELNALWELQGRLQLLLFQLPEAAQSPTSASVYLSDSDPLRSLS